jgi:hypothetical protein
MPVLEPHNEQPTTSTPSLPLPDVARMAARLAEYRNSTEEADTIRAVDRAVFDKVAQHEQALVANVRAFQETFAVDEAAAKDLTVAFEEEIRDQLDTREGAMPELLERYAELRSMATRAIEALKRADREAEWHLAKLADPYADYAAVVSKYPSLRSGHALF